MDNSIFRKKSLERISSPESLNDYLHVTSPAVWLILTAVILLLAGMLIWSSVASIDSFATGSARVEKGSMYIEFDNEQIADNVQPGMTVIAGETESRITSIGTNDMGELFALAPTGLPDGFYTVRVLFRQTQVLAYANLDRSQVDFVKRIELDYEHGRKVYEIKFYQGGFEYEFDVDAENGSILKYEKDFD